MSLNTIKSFHLTRFEFRRDRVIGDSQVKFEMFYGFALELTDGAGHTGLGFGHSMWDPVSPLANLEKTFTEKLWPSLDGANPQALIHRVVRPRGGNLRDSEYGFSEALQIALWDLAAQQAGLSLSAYLGGTEPSVRSYASGLDFHLSDKEFSDFFAKVADRGFDTFKVKVGHKDPEWDLHRLELLRDTVGQNAGIMVDSNEAWTPKEAMLRLNLFRRAGLDLIWSEDPILRSDIAGLRALSDAVTWTQINTGEYLDVAGRTNLLVNRAGDIFNLHGRVTEVMRVGWLAAELGLPVALGNTTFETGVHAACALPNAEWLEYSFQNYDHLVETPVEFRDGRAFVPERPGLGLSLSEAARTTFSAPEPIAPGEAITGPPCKVLSANNNEAQ